MDKLTRALQKSKENRPIALPPLRWVLLGVAVIVGYILLRRVARGSGRETLEQFAQLPGAKKTEVSEK